MYKDIAPPRIAFSDRMQPLTRRDPIDSSALTVPTAPPTASCR